MYLQVLSILRFSEDYVKHIFQWDNRQYYRDSSIIALTMSKMACRLLPFVLLVIIENTRSPASVVQTPDNDLTPPM
jgi:hypothetical protein